MTVNGNFEYIRNMYINEPHLRIEVIVTFKGEKISNEEYKSNFEISEKLPKQSEFDEYYANVLKEAGLSRLNYQIHISESGFSLSTSGI